MDDDYYFLLIFPMPQRTHVSLISSDGHPMAMMQEDKVEDELGV